MSDFSGKPSGDASESNPRKRTVFKFRSNPADELSLGTLFHILENKRRRLLLYILEDQSRQTLFADELVTEVIQVEDDIDSSLTEEEKTRIELSIYHNHIPKLDNAGIITYDEVSGRIQYHGNPILTRWVREARELEKL